MTHSLWRKPADSTRFPHADSSAVTVTSPACHRQNAGMLMQTTYTGTFYGWRVVAAAFVLALFGWGMGFYGPPVFLAVVSASKGWPLALVSIAVTAQFPHRRRRRGQSAENLSPLRCRDGDQGRCPLACRRDLRLGHRRCAVAAVRSGPARRRGLGRDERRCAQRDCVALVRARAAARARDGL